MLGIKINGEWLDIAPDTLMEIEHENPFLQFGEEIVGQFSLPFEVDASPKNLRLLNYSGLIQRRIDNTGIPAEIYDNGLQVAVGKIKIEKPTHNLNRVADGKISCYFLTGTSSFYQDIKNKKMRDIDLGGTRSFDQPFAHLYDESWTGGFWKHIHDVINAGTGYGVSGYDYAFFPVKNEEWKANGPLADNSAFQLMNSVKFDTGAPRFTHHNDPSPRPIVPFPYLKYVLIRLFDYVGWKVAGNILDDTDFIKIVLINFRAIKWMTITMDPGPPLLLSFTFFGTVEFDLKDSMPPDMPIATFLIALKNRMGWWYDFDKVNRVVTIKKLQDVTSSVLKDVTKWANPLVVKTINQDKKIYSLINDWIGNLGDGAPNFTNVTNAGSVNELTDLPAAGPGLYATVYLVIAENNYYICAQNVGTGAWEWEIFAANIYNYVPDGATDEIKSAATTVGVESFNSYLDLIPRIDLQGEWFGITDGEPGEWGIHLCFYQGLRPNKSDDNYPYGCSHIYDSKFNQVGEWALTFTCLKADGSDVGLYELDWKTILAMLTSDEQFQATINLPLYEYLQLNFGDRLIIAGVKMWIQKIKPKIPYQGSIDVETVRIF